MKNRRNLIAISQSQGKISVEGKIYIACIRENINGEFEVYSKTGHLEDGKNNVPLVRTRWFTTNNLHQAEVYQERMFKAKLKKGFQDIEDSIFNGSLRLAFNAELETESDSDVDPDDIAPVEASAAPVIPAIPDDVVTCINNAGMEDKFDIGIEYIWDKSSFINDSDLICVYDKNGVKGEFFRDRFE
jgi:hypothetical protein